MGAPLPDVIQTAVVTGAASGVGARIARALHAAGFRVVISDIDSEGASALATDLDLAGETAVTATLEQGGSLMAQAPSIFKKFWTRSSTDGDRAKCW